MWHNNRILNLYVVGHEQKGGVKSFSRYHLYKSCRNVTYSTYMLHCPLQIPVVCTPHEHHWSSNYHHIQSPTLLQCTPPLFPLSRLTLQLAEHLRSNYKTAGQLCTVKLLTYKCFSTTSEWVARVRACNSIKFETGSNSLLLLKIVTNT